MSKSDGTVHASLAQGIVDHGITTLFGLMGDANLFMVDHYVRACEGRFVPVAYEGSAVLMALAYSRFAQTVGIATVTHGPGVTNCMTALAEGARARAPMVLMAGDTPVANPQNLQNIDQRELAKAAGVGFEQMRTPETASEDFARAFHRARVEERPILFNMPAEMMWAEVEHRRVVHPVFDDPTLAPKGAGMEEAIGIIASAKRPVVLAGAGAIGARANVIALAERLEAPLATTLKAKGLFNGHANDMGLFGTLSTDAAYEAIDRADCIVAIGASLHHFTTDRGKLLAGKRVVQVERRVEEIGRNFHPDAMLVGDAALNADNIVHWLDEAEIAPSGFMPELAGADLRAHAPPRDTPVAEGRVPFIAALTRLEAMLPANRILTTDGGRFMTEVWCRISAPDARSFIATTNFGAIGIGLPYAIGAGFAVENRPVVLFTGDGGFMMGGINEFNTAVRMKQDLIVIVCNDAAYGAEHIQFLDRDMNPGLSEFEWPSFAAVASALGGTGVTVASLDDLDEAAEVMEARDGPLLIELRLDPADVPRMRA